MSWRRPYEPLVLFAVAVLVPLMALGWLAGERRTAGVEPRAAAMPHGEVLASPREDRGLPAERWLELALEAPRSFGRALGWCQRRREAPLPNCRNVVVADRVCAALGTVEPARWGDG